MKGSRVIDLLERLYVFVFVQRKEIVRFYIDVPVGNPAAMLDRIGKEIAPYEHCAVRVQGREGSGYWMFVGGKDSKPATSDMFNDMPREKPRW